jgi:hypothetical protein
MSVSTRSWVEIGSVVALVAGLALVSVQIKQSTDITRIQLETSLIQNWRMVDSTRQSEEFAKVLAKSIEQPQDLTLAEFFELDAYYLGVTDQIQSLASQVEAGYGDSTLDDSYALNAEIYFGNSFASAWANRQLGESKEGWAQAFLAAIQRVDSGATEAKYRGILQDIE